MRLIRKQWNRRILLLLCLMAALFNAGMATAATAPLQSVTTEGVPYENSEQAATEFLDANLYMVEGFCSHLPVAVVRQNNIVEFHLKNEALSVDERSSYTSQYGYWKELWSEEAAPGRPERSKRNYSVTVPPSALTGLQAALWEEPVTGEWYLSGNMYDKSLIRNYLALSIARDLGNAAYLAQHCEVFRATDEGLLYQGVYLLTAPLSTAQYQFQRGNYWFEGSEPVNTYASENGLLADGLYVPPMYALESSQLAQMQRLIDTAEKSIYSYDYNAFSSYATWLDLEKLYDYFILYELFGNHSSAHLSRYMVDPQKQVFWPVVLADFEFSVDNEQQKPLDIARIELDKTPYYSALVKSINFIDGLLSRYHYLAQDLLKTNHLTIRIDEAVAQLGNAQLRDWACWEYSYNSAEMYLLASSETVREDNLPSLNRNAYSYEQEINRLKFNLREHGNYMFGGIADLYKNKNLVGNEGFYVQNSWLFVLFLGIIIVSIRIVRRKMQ